MAGSKQSLTTLDILIEKLSHQLEEIRIRSLNNILSKLEHGIIQEEDLVQNKSLLTHLLRWFNFSSQSNQTDVLKLLLRLSKYSSSAQLLVSIGAVDFFHSLRSNLNSSLQEIVDQILEQLFLLHELDTSLETQTFLNEDPVSKNGEHKNAELESTNAKFACDADPMELADKNTDYIQRFLEPAAISRNECPNALSKISYFEASSPSHLCNSNTNALGTVNCIVFPWLILTNTDNHILSSTNNSLKSGDSTAIAASCNFLNDVVLQDFPAEIFLQRPQILKTLLGLLHESSNNVKLMLQILDCLQTLSLNLLSRMTCQIDPSMLNSRTEIRISSPSRPSSQGLYSGSGSPLSSDSRPSAVGQSEAILQRRIDQSNKETAIAEVTLSSNENIPSDSEQELEEDILELHLRQMSLQEYCICILNESLSLFQCFNYQVISFGIILIHNSMDLLGRILEICYKDRHILCTNLINMLSNFFLNFGNVLRFHQEKIVNNSENNIRFHRLTCLNLVICLHRIFKMIFSSQISLSSIKLPQALLDVLQLVIFDYSFMYCYPDIHAEFLELISCLDVDTHAYFIKTREVCEAMESACRFMLRGKENNSYQLLQDAELALTSLPYHKTITFVEMLIADYSLISSQNNSNSDIYQKGLDVILKLLSHNMQVIRLAAYKNCLLQLKNVFEVQQLSDITLVNKIRFLFETEILHNFCVNGLFDKNAQIKETVCDVLTILIQSQMKMPQDFWNNFITNLCPFLPILQGFADYSSAFGHCITSIVDPSISSLPLLEIIKGNLRLMLSTNKKLRSSAFFNLSLVYSKQNDAFQKIFANDSPDLFITDNLSDISNCGFNTSAYQVDNLLSVLEIMKSSDMEIDIKKSAIQQLAFLLESISLHDRFIKEKGILVLHNIIEDIFKSSDLLSLPQNLKDMLSSCIHIFAILITHNPLLRNELAEHQNVYRNIIIGALLLGEFQKTKCDLIQTLVLLLFDKFIQITEKHPPKEGGDLNSYYVISVPPKISLRYQIPFLLENCNGNQILCNSTDENTLPDPLLNYPAINMLQLAWNVHWFGGIETLINTNKIENYKEFHSVLQLSKIDQYICKITYSPIAVSNCLESIKKAATHKEVYQALQVLKLQLLARINHRNVLSSDVVPWKEAFERFLFLPPKSRADENLLYDILNLLTFIVYKCKMINISEVISWLSSVILNTNNAIISLIMNRVNYTEKQADKRNPKALGVLLIKFVTALTAIEIHKETKSESSSKIAFGSLITSFIQNLILSDAHHFYNLSVLEATLKCLLHLTAKPKWSKGADPMEQEALLKNLFITLVDVISAFHAGPDGIDNSFMGKGVTKTATLILRHLIIEMNQYADGNAWIKKCIEEPVSDTSHQLGLMWLIPLWTYRDPEVRASSLGICVSLSSTVEGSIILSKHLKELSGGVWGVSLSFLLDHAEASFVKEQAAYLLAQLIAWPMSSSDEEVWRGPEIYDSHSEVCMIGTEALLSLLHHSNFYKEMAVLLSQYFPHQFVPISCVERNVKPSNFASTVSLSGNSNIYLAKMMENENILETTGQDSNDVEIPTEREAIKFTDSFQPHFMVMTPSLVSAVSCILYNLIEILPEDTLLMIQDEAIIESLLRCLDYYRLVKHSSCSTAFKKQFFKDLTKMHLSVLMLIANCITHDEAVAEKITCDDNNIRNLIKLLDVNLLCNTKNAHFIYGMWSNVYKLLSILLNKQKVKSLMNVNPLIILMWEMISDNLQYVLRDEMPDGLLMESLKFFSLICILEAKTYLQNNCSDQGCETPFIVKLETMEIDSDNDVFEKQSSGSVLTKLLLEKYRKYLITSQSKTSYFILINALRSILLVSNTAKLTAMQDDLISVVLDHIKDIHIQITVKSFSSPSVVKKKEPEIYEDLLSHLMLMNDFLYNFVECKIAAAAAGLCDVVHLIWPWCIQDSHLMTIILKLLCTFTANSEPGASSMAMSNPNPVNGIGVNKIPVTGSFLHSLLRIVQCEIDRFPSRRDCTHLILMFEIFNNLCAAADSRNILCKSNFIEELFKLNQQKSNATKNYQTLEKLWFNFLTNLSLYQDGQEAIFRLKGGIELLFDVAENSSFMKKSAIIILRNLCHNSAHRANLLNSGHLIPLLVTSINEASMNLKLAAASALWALCANCQKAKMLIKNEKIWFLLNENKRHYQNSTNENKKLGNILETIVDICTVKI